MSDTTPVNLLEIIEIIGEAAALKLVESFGGQRVRIPAHRNVSEDHPLAKCLGVEILHKLIGLDSGRLMYIPRCAKGLRAQRDRDIVTQYSPPYNVSVNALAERYNLSYRRVEQILASTVVDDRQVSLF